MRVSHSKIPVGGRETYLKSTSLFQVPPGGEAIGAGSSGPSVDLSTALTGEALQPILSQEGFLDKVWDRFLNLQWQ